MEIRRYISHADRVSATIQYRLLWCLRIKDTLGVGAHVLNSEAVLKWYNVGSVISDLDGRVHYRRLGGGYSGMDCTIPHLSNQLCVHCDDLPRPGGALEATEFCFFS